MVVTLQEGLIAMRVFKDIERVVRTSERSVALKRKKKEDTVLKRRLALLVLEGRAYAGVTLPAFRGARYNRPAA
jgi:hypothetical protein